MSRLTIIGLLGTFIYISSAGTVTFLKWAQFSQLSPNEWGDFFGGVFGPLALFWVVLGFFQQGDELRNSVKTLELQAKELANSVEQQRELVAVTRDSIEYEKFKDNDAKDRHIEAIAPRFEARIYCIQSTVDSFEYRYHLTNFGGDALNCRVNFSTRIGRTANRNLTRLATGEHDGPIDPIFIGPEIQNEIEVVIACEDIEGNEKTASFTLLPDSEPQRAVTRNVLGLV